MLSFQPEDNTAPDGFSQKAVHAGGLRGHVRRTLGDAPDVRYDSANLGEFIWKSLHDPELLNEPGASAPGNLEERCDPVPAVVLLPAPILFESSFDSCNRGNGRVRMIGVKASALSRQLRTGSGEFLEKRRGIVMACLGAIGCMGLIALYQMGVIKHLPEPAWPGLDGDKVDASDEAYSDLQMGDAFFGLGSYAATMGLAAMGSKDRAETQPWLPLLLSTKTTADAAQAAKLAYDQFAKYKAACMWCLIAAAATFVSAGLAIPEARAAARALRKNRALLN